MLNAISVTSFTQTARDKTVQEITLFGRLSSCTLHMLQIPGSLTFKQAWKKTPVLHTT